MTDLLLDTVGTFVTREVYPAAGIIDETDEVPSGLVDSMRALGVLGLADEDVELPDVLRVVEVLGGGSATVALLVVAPDAVAGEPRDRTGLRGLRTDIGSVRTRGQLALAAGAAAIGAAERALDETVRYLEQRQAFGQVLIDVPVLAAMVRERREELAAARVAVSGCAADPELRRAPAAARTAARAAVAASYDAIQLHGGYGYTSEYQVERIARDCVSLRALIAELGDDPATRTS